MIVPVYAAHDSVKTTDENKIEKIYDKRKILHLLENTCYATSYIELTLLVVYIWLCIVDTLASRSLSNL
jgi:hypothetical protein